MLERLLLLTLPAATVTLLGVAMLGPGASRAIYGAQVRGGLGAPVRALSLRLLVIERAQGIDVPYDIGGLTLEATSDKGSRAMWQGRTGHDGSAEALVPLEGFGSVHLSLASSSDRPLAEGTVRGSPPGTTRERGNVLGTLLGAASGDLTVEIAPLRGALSAPFRDTMAVRVRRNGTPVRDAELRFTAEGATLDPDEAGASALSGHRTTDQDGRAVVGLTPQLHTVDLRVEASSEGLRGTWDGTVPVVPGAMWLAPERSPAGLMKILAPAPHEFAYVTVTRRDTRLWGAVVPLFRDAAGFAVGQTSWPSTAASANPAGGDWMTLSSDPEARGSGTVHWPLFEPKDPFVSESSPPRDLLLLDGMPASERRDQARLRRARMLAALALFAGASLEALLLLRIARKEDRVLLRWSASEPEFASQAAGRLAGRGAGARVALAIATVIFAFAALGIVAMWKAGG